MIPTFAVLLNENSMSDAGMNAYQFLWNMRPEIMYYSRCSLFDSICLHVEKPTGHSDSSRLLLPAVIWHTSEFTIKQRIKK